MLTLVISESHGNVQPRVLKIMSLDIKTTCFYGSSSLTLHVRSKHPEDISRRWRNRISRLCETDLRSICFSCFPLSLARCTNHFGGNAITFNLISTLPRTTTRGASVTSINYVQFFVNYMVIIRY